MLCLAWSHLLRLTYQYCTQTASACFRAFKTSGQCFGPQQERARRRSAGLPPAIVLRLRRCGCKDFHHYFSFKIQKIQSCLTQFNHTQRYPKGYFFNLIFERYNSLYIAINNNWFLYQTWCPGLSVYCALLFFLFSLSHTIAFCIVCALYYLASGLSLSRARWLSVRPIAPPSPLGRATAHSCAHLLLITNELQVTQLKTARANWLTCWRYTSFPMYKSR